MHLYGTQSINDRGHLAIGGVDTVDLANTYGTPLIVYDINLFRERARAFKKTFQAWGLMHKLLMQVKHFHQLLYMKLQNKKVFRSMLFRWRVIYCGSSGFSQGTNSFSWEQ